MDLDVLAQAGEEWEYEYDPVEKETFLIDVDLTSINRPVMSANATKAKRGLKIVERTKLQKPGQSRSKPSARQDSSSAARLGASVDGDEIIGPHENELNEDQPESPSSRQDEAEDSAGDRLQMLDLHTENPILSYRGNLYSCTWNDMIGTNIFFSKHVSSNSSKPAVSTEDFDIIGTTRIKLVGNLVSVTPLEEKDTNGTADKAKPTQSANSRPGAGLGDLKTTNPKTNADIRKQANFLERLMEVKRARGEPDAVKVVANQKIARASATTRPYSANKRRKLNELNKRAVKGDGQAVKQLKDIYSGLDNTNSDEEELEQEEGSENVSTPLRRPQRSIRRRRIVEPESAFEDDEASSQRNQSPASNASASSSRNRNHTDNELGQSGLTTP